MAGVTGLAVATSLPLPGVIDPPADLHRYGFLFASGAEVVRAGGDGPLDPAPDVTGRVVGAIPFAEGAAPVLLCPERFERTIPRPRGQREAAPNAESRIVAIPDRAEYTRLVASVVQALREHTRLGGPLRKVVLARRLDIVQDVLIDVDRLAARLRLDRNVTTVVLRANDKRGRCRRALLAASPEVLLEKRDGKVWSIPLAGSARRSARPSDDEAAGRRLLASNKDLEEHRLVVEYVLDTLASFCVSLSAPPRPRLSRTASMWHLATRVEGELRDPETPSLEIARRLHPTPAVCGVPTAESARLISQLEPFSRGLYGGAVGWSDGTGDGRWMVTLRCAEISGHRASLFAGAGIMANSDPDAECEETSAKFRALLSAFGIAENGGGAPKAR